MNWVVRWRRSARRQAAKIWRSATDRNRVADAVDDLLRALKHDPHLYGESRYGNVRIVDHRPFQVLFSVDHGDGVVKILRISWIGP